MALIEIRTDKQEHPRVAEWRAVVEVEQHFNDLLMRLRAFGLPIVATVAGAGFTLGLNNNVARLEDWTAAAFVSANAVIVTLVVPFLLWVRGWGSKGHEPLNSSERLLWWSVVFVALSMAAAFWSLVRADRIQLTAQHQYTAGPLVLLFALTVLIVLYALDRFYYFKLLLGGVSRARTLEDELGYKMTATISDFVLPQHAASIITLLYYLPGMAGYIALLILVGLNPLLGDP